MKSLIRYRDLSIWCVKKTNQHLVSLLKYVLLILCVIYLPSHVIPRKVYKSIFHMRYMYLITVLMDAFKYCSYLSNIR